MIDRTDLALAEAALQREMALKRIFDCCRVHHLAVVELHPGPQMNQQRPVIGPLVSGGELRHDVQLLVDVEQLVAQSGEHDAPDVGRGQRGIEHVEILPQRNPQRLRERRQSGGGHNGRGQQKTTHHEAPRHRCYGDQVGGLPSRAMAASITVRSNTPHGLSAPARKRRNTANRSRLTAYSRRSSASGSG